MDREIAELPIPPDLTKPLIQSLTQLCFRKDDHSIPSTEGIFVFGSTISLDVLAKKIEQAIEKKVANRLILTGGIVTYSGSPIYTLTQSKMIYQKLQKNLPPEIEVLFEESSQNTLDNVRLGLATIKSTPHSICFISKSFHCGRCYLTLRKFLPKATIYQISYEPHYVSEPQKISRENWHLFPQGRARVWGEFLRIQRYGLRGDIADREIANLITKIEKTCRLAHKKGSFCCFTNPLRDLKK